jgi:hypothetical protein
MTIGGNLPFGRDDRELLRQISNKLSQVTVDLAAVKQQVTDQQYTVNQIRQDATAASIATGLAEIRSVVREGINDIVTGPVANIGSELVAVRGDLARLDDQLRTGASPAAEPPTLEPAPTSKPATGPDQQMADEGPLDLKTLRAAAGISAAVLHAHHDTWEFLVKHAGTDQHFHVPGAVTHEDGAVTVHLSGPSLVAVLTSLGDVRRDTAAGLGTQAIAHHLHQRIGDLVKKIAQDPRTSSDSAPVTIRIDDRLKPDDDSDVGEDEQQ